MNTVYRVYWSQIYAAELLEFNGTFSVMFADFNKDQMTEALQFSESLRARRRAGEELEHIVMSCEHPDSVGEQGVDVTGPEYEWKKRRI